MAARFANSSDGRLPLTRYRLVREAKGAQPLTKDADSFLAGLVVPPELVPRLSPLWSDQSMIPINERELVLPRLQALAKGFHQANPPQMLMTQPRVAAMSKRVDAALAAAAGISVDVAPESNALVPGVPTNFKITVTNHGSAEARLVEVELGGMGHGAGGPASGPGRPTSTRPVAPGQSVTLEREFQTSRDAAVTIPHQEHLYDGREFGEQFTARVQVLVNGGSFTVPATVSVDVAPAVEITNLSPSPAVRTPPDRKTKLTGTMDCTLRDFDYKVRLTNHQDAPFSGQLIVGPGFYRKAAYRPITIAAHDTADLIVSVPGCPQQADPKRASQEKAAPISFTVAGNGAKEPLARLEVPIVFADARTAPNIRVGYVRGFDFSLPNALNALGVESKELSVDEVKTADLQKYSSIIVDNRVYESTPGLIAANQKLLDYANAGGTLIVFYHKSFEWNPDERRQRPQLAPYKLILGDERIVDENAPVTFLEPQHPLLNSPNKIEPEDFANWIQERGLYYPKEWDPQFHALLQSNDPGEAPLKGGLLVADYGRGRYIYTSMVWYRELRAGVPGAYRVLANMISYGHGRYAAVNMAAMNIDWLAP